MKNFPIVTLRHAFNASSKLLTQGPLKFYPQRFVFGWALLFVTYVLAYLSIRTWPALFDPVATQGKILWQQDKKRLQVPGMLPLENKKSALTLSGDAQVAQEVAPDKKTPSRLGDLVEIPPPAVQLRRTFVTLEKGMTFDYLLQKVRLLPQERNAIVVQLRNLCALRKLKVGTRFNLAWSPNETGEELVALSFQYTFDRSICVEKDRFGKWQASLHKQPVTKRRRVLKGMIAHSFYHDVRASGMHQDVLMRLIACLKNTFDVKSAFRKQDRFFVVLEERHNAVTKQVQQKDCVLLACTSRGKPYYFYRYKSKKGEIGFFDEKGHMLHEAGFLTPVPGARLSSGFGYRSHPLLGYRVFHRGIDLAAPTGTRVKAALGGRVLRAGRNGGYGHYILLQHEGGYKTAYAHLNGYGPGVRVGVYVQAGQTIGYVGASGRVTGPHLHFEVLKGNVHTNPLKVKRLPTCVLSGKSKAAFHVYADKLKKRYGAEDFLGFGTSNTMTAASASAEGTMLNAS